MRKRLNRALVALLLGGICSIAGAGEEPALLTEADLEEAIPRLKRIADGWPPRIETPEEREEAEALWRHLEKSLLKMRTDDPEDYYFALWLGDCYRMGHNLDIEDASANAITHLQAASRLDPEAFLPHLILGDHYTYSARPDEGEREYLLALELSDRPLPSAYHGLANAYYHQKEFAKVVEYANRFLEHVPDNESMKFLRERATAALEGRFEPRIIVIESDEPPDGKIRAASPDDIKDD